MDAIFSRRFSCCLFECGPAWTQSTFDDGHVNFLDFAHWIQRGDNADLAGELGYAGCETLYYWEHDFIHHWIADRNGDGPSAAIRHGDASVRVRDASLAIRYEEWLVHHLQAWVRADGDPEDLLSLEGWDAQQAMCDLRGDLATFFGPLHALAPIVRRWAPQTALETLGRMRPEHYDYYPTTPKPLHPPISHYEARAYVVERGRTERQTFRMPDFYMPEHEFFDVLAALP